MNRIYRSSLILLLSLFVFAISVSAQRTYRLTRPCPSSTTPGIVEVERDGDVNVRPCSGRDFLVNGIAPAGSSITFSGSGRTTYIPYFTTNTNLTKSPFSWNGTRYLFSDTAETATFDFAFTPATGAAGLFEIGTATNFLTFDGSGVFTLNPSTSLNLTAGGGTSTFNIDGGTNNIGISSSNQLDLDSAATNVGSSGVLSLTSTGNTTIRSGTASGATFGGTSTFLGDVGFTDTSGLLSMSATTTQLNPALSQTLILGGSGQSLRINTATDVLSSTIATWDMSAAGGAGFGVTSFLYNRTITAGGDQSSGRNGELCGGYGNGRDHCH
jgi:hypothetical protein